MFLESRLERMVGRMRGKPAIPLRLELWKAIASTCVPIPQ